MPRNPLMPKRPNRVRFVNQKKSGGILDDYAIRKNLSTKEGTIEHTPTVAKHIVNKEYVDSSVGNYVLKAGDTMTGDLEIQNDTANSKLKLTSTDGTKNTQYNQANTVSSITTNSHPLELKPNNATVYINKASDNNTLIIRDSANANALVLEGTTTAGNITAASGEISFGNENLTTTGTLDVTGTATLTNITTTNNIKSMPRYWDFTLMDPNGLYDIDAQVFIAWAPAALTITKIQVELDNTLAQVAGDLKYANAFIGFASPVVINDFDTTSGKRTDTSITSGSVASGKAIYLQFDSQPASSINQMHVHIEYDFD